jgi:hypothetical protein
MKIGKVGVSRNCSKGARYIGKFGFVLGQLLSFLDLKKNKEPRVNFHIDKTNNYFFQKINLFLKLEIVKYFMT